MIDVLPTGHAKSNGRLLALLATMQPLDEEDAMPVIEDFPAEHVDLRQDAMEIDAESGTAGR
jgi:hypothetical protein